MTKYFAKESDSLSGFESFVLLMIKLSRRMDDRGITNELQIVASLFKHFFKALCLNLRIVWSMIITLIHAGIGAEELSG